MSESENKKDLANASYLSVFILKFLPLVGGKKNLSSDEKIAVMEICLNMFNDSPSYRTLNNKIRKHFDDGQTLSHADYRADFFYEGTWCYEHLKQENSLKIEKETASTLVSTDILEGEEYDENLEEPAALQERKELELVA